ncbi:c-type cytochrome biogenesis protein CcmI [Nioella nitratireducens]|uniref:c-type cytochrome biogenesis protein CcmI n=1 Tax=Nioella nitratireducens TaxID=1287720 RepID=UPI0008FCFD7A|nr:c-type cytochrome biogenesis protein CcmI [Nioella nitratireducens]
MTLFLTFVAMSALAILFVLLALRRGGMSSGDRDAGAIAVLRDQLVEIERDEARGLINIAEARDAGIEVKRRLLTYTGGQTRAAPSPRRGAWVLVPALAVVLTSGIGLYLVLGQPSVPSMPFAERGAERAAASELAGLAAELRDRLEAEPDGGAHEGWILLGRTFMRMNDYSAAVGAFTVASERPEASSASFSQLAEAMIANEDGIVTPLAEAAIARAVEMDPLNPAAIYYHAIALDQTGSSAMAYDALAARIAVETEIAPWMQIFTARLNQIGERIGRAPVGPMMLMAGSDALGPDAADMAAAAEMSAEDRAAMVQSMVARLAARLEEEPDDLEGWLRLANSYRVLGDLDAARAALARAEPLLPETGPARQSFDDLSDDLGE